MEHWHPAVGDRVEVWVEEHQHPQLYSSLAATRVRRYGEIVAIDSAITWFGWPFQVRLDETGQTLPFRREELTREG